MAKANMVLPPSLLAYKEGRAPGMLFSQSGHTRAPQPAQPPRSRLLQDMMTQPNQGADLAKGVVQGGANMWQGYNNTQPRESFVEDPSAADARSRAGYGQIASGLLGAGGAFLPGWAGKVAQIAGMMTDQYSQNQLVNSREQQFKTILSEPDADKRNRMMMFMLAADKDK